MVVKNQKNEMIGNCQQFVAIINSIIKSTIGLVTDLITNLMKCLIINSITEVIVAFNQKNMKMLRFFISLLDYEVLFFILLFNLFFIILQFKIDLHPLIYSFLIIYYYFKLHYFKLKYSFPNYNFFHLQSIPHSSSLTLLLFDIQFFSFIKRKFSFICKFKLKNYKIFSILSSSFRSLFSFVLQFKVASKGFLLQIFSCIFSSFYNFRLKNYKSSSILLSDCLGGIK